MAIDHQISLNSLFLEKSSCHSNLPDGAAVTQPKAQRKQDQQIQEETHLVQPGQSTQPSQENLATDVTSHVATAMWALGGERDSRPESSLHRKQ